MFKTQDLIDRKELAMEVLGLTIVGPEVATYASAVLDKIHNAKRIEITSLQTGKWTQQYRSGLKVTSGFVSSCCDKWSSRASDYCPDCGRMMEISK